MHIRPDYLQKGDQVVIIAPAGRVKEHSLDHAVSQLTAWGLRVTISDHAESGYHYFSATDTDRLADLQESIDSTIYKAIFCARGGYGITRILDKVDFSPLQKLPKWIVGFSDITALHLALSAHGLQSIHSVMPAGFQQADQVAVNSLRQVLFGQSVEIEVPHNPSNRNGSVEAPIIGGNLSLLSSSIGTMYELETDSKILFVEEIDEHLYKIDRMLGQLGRSGKLSKLKGLVVGQLSEMKDTSIPFGKEVNSLILDHVSEYNYPVLFDISIGHEALNLAVVQEGVYKMEVADKGGRIQPLDNKASD